MATRKSYTPEFKREAVRLADERGNRSAVARELGIHTSMIRRWKDQLEENGTRAVLCQGNPRDEENAKLRCELKRVKEENAILKKAVGIFKGAPWVR
jgi:transposase